MAEQKRSSQGTEVNKNSTSYTSVMSPPKKKKKKKKEKKNKERVWGQTIFQHIVWKGLFSLWVKHAIVWYSNGLLLEFLG